MAIVLSYHGNEESEAALEESLRMSVAFGTTLVVVLARRTGQEDERTVEDAEDRLWSHLGSSGIAFEVRHTRSDQDVADAVLDAASSTDADRIVLGLRPGGSGHTTIGPNASRILLDAPCPVVTTTPHPRP